MLNVSGVILPFDVVCTSLAAIVTSQKSQEGKLLLDCVKTEGLPIQLLVDG